MTRRVSMMRGGDALAHGGAPETSPRELAVIVFDCEIRLRPENRPTPPGQPVHEAGLRTGLMVISRPRSTSSSAAHGDRTVGVWLLRPSRIVRTAISTGSTSGTPDRASGSSLLAFSRRNRQKLVSARLLARSIVEVGEGTERACGASRHEPRSRPDGRQCPRRAASDLGGASHRSRLSRGPDGPRCRSSCAVRLGGARGGGR